MTSAQAFLLIASVWMAPKCPPIVCFGMGVFFSVASFFTGIALK